MMNERQRRTGSGGLGGRGRLRRSRSRESPLEEQRHAGFLAVRAPLGDGVLARGLVERRLDLGKGRAAIGGTGEHGLFESLEFPLQNATISPVMLPALHVLTFA